MPLSQHFRALKEEEEEERGGKGCVKGAYMGTGEGEGGGGTIRCGLPQKVPPKPVEELRQREMLKPIAF